MKTSIALLTGLLVCGSVTAAGAATARENFQKQVAKVAPPADAKPKALCACVYDAGSPAFANRVGFIRQQLRNDQVHVFCAGGAYDGDGNDVGTFFCENFYPLAK